MNKETIKNLMRQITPYDDGVRKFLKKEFICIKELQAIKITHSPKQPKLIFLNW